jgi:hypothetical protein
VAKQVIAAQRARIESVIELNELSIVHVFVISNEDSHCERPCRDDDEPDVPSFRLRGSVGQRD